jgi:hypothetical protein
MYSLPPEREEDTGRGKGCLFWFLFSVSFVFGMLFMRGLEAEGFGSVALVGIGSFAAASIVSALALSKRR